MQTWIKPTNYDKLEPGQQQKSICNASWEWDMQNNDFISSLELVSLDWIFPPNSPSRSGGRAFIHALWNSVSVFPKYGPLLSHPSLVSKVFCFLFYSVGKLGNFSGLLQSFMSWAFCSKKNRQWPWLHPMSLKRIVHLVIDLVHKETLGIGLRVETVSWVSGESLHHRTCQWAHNYSVEEQSCYIRPAVWIPGPQSPRQPTVSQALPWRLRPAGFHWHHFEHLRKETFNYPNQLSLQDMCF